MELFSEHLLRCPACKDDFCSLDDKEGKSFICPKCNMVFPITAGVVDMAPNLVFKRTAAQMFMESSAIVSIYESKLWRRSIVAGAAMGIPFDKEAAIIAGAADVKSAKSVLDLACGPGIYTRSFAREIGPEGKIVGLDLSMPMLQWGARKLRREKLKNVIYIRGNAMDLPFENGTFDVVNCCGALHLFPDTNKALNQISRVLAPGGRFTTAVFRSGKGSLAKLRKAYWKKMGVNSYTPEGLSGLLAEKGLNSAKCHHAKGVWLIMSARKI